MAFSKISDPDETDPDAPYQASTPNPHTLTQAQCRGALSWREPRRLLLFR